MVIIGTMTNPFASMIYAAVDMVTTRKKTVNGSSGGYKLLTQEEESEKGDFESLYLQMILLVVRQHLRVLRLVSTICEPPAYN